MLVYTEVEGWHTEGKEGSVGSVARESVRGAQDGAGPQAPSTS